jgi:tRNA modification GTPase
MVIDGSEKLEAGDWEIEKLVGNKPALLVINKNDLTSVAAPADFLPAARRIRISALAGEGIEALEEAIVELVAGGSVILADTPLVSNPRHKALLQHALSHTQAAIAAQQAGLSPDLVSIDVRAAVDALGEITGETVTEDLLDTIFSKFCIGK